MFAALTTNVRHWFGYTDAERAAQPLLAGYRRTAPGWVRLALLGALAAACLVYGFAFGISAPVRIMPFTVPIVLTSAIILWTLPPGEYAPKSALEPFFIGFFASMVLWPNYLAIDIGNLPWITFSRLTIVPLTILLLACLSISKSFRAELWDIVSAEKTIFRLFLALNILWTLSIPISIDPATSLNTFMYAQLGATVVFFVSCYLFQRPGFAHFWVYLMLLLMVVLCFMGIWEWNLQQLPWTGYIPGFLKVDDPLAVKIMEKYAAGGLRVRVSATTPLGLAELLGLSTPFAMHFALGRYNFWIRLGSILYIPLAVFVILLTDSRLGVVAACGAVMFYLLVWSVLRWRRLRGSLFAPAIVLSYPLLFLAFMASTFVIGRLRVEFWGAGSQQASTQGRLDQWAAGFPRVLQHPFGHGIGQAAKALNFRNARGELTIDSYWLSVLLDIGFLGFLAFYGLMLYAAFSATKTAVQEGRSRDVMLLLPITVMLINFVIVKMVFSQEANHPIIFMMLGAVTGLTHLANKQAAEKARAA